MSWRGVRRASIWQTAVGRVMRRRLYVSGDFFRVLGVKAVLGRTLTTQDDTKTCNAGAVLSYPYWQREFGGDANVPGRTISLNGFSVPVIGVTPEGFFGLEVGTQFDIAVPLLR